MELETLQLLTNFLYNPLISDIFLAIICPSGSRFKIEIDQQIEIWKYCYKNNVFLDLASRLLRGAEISKDYKSKLDILKFNFPFVYEKTQKKTLVLPNGESEQIDLEKLLGKSTFSEFPMVNEILYNFCLS